MSRPMLSKDQVNEIWRLLDRVGAFFAEKRGTDVLRQSDAMEEILSAATSASDWTREQILEAWMHQALAFIHATTGKFSSDPDLPLSDLLPLWNAIQAAEQEVASENDGKVMKLTSYVSETIARVSAATGSRHSREQLFRAWVMKRFVDDMRGQSPSTLFMRLPTAPSDGLPS